MTAKLREIIVFIVNLIVRINFRFLIRSFYHYSENEWAYMENSMAKQSSMQKMAIKFLNFVNSIFHSDPKCDRQLFQLYKGAMIKNNIGYENKIVVKSSSASTQ